MRRLLLILSIFLSLASNGDARSIKPLEGLEALRKAFADTTDFTAEITQEKRLSLMKRTMTMNGSVRFKKPDMFYLEISSPYNSRMLLRDSTIEQITAGGGRSRVVLTPEQGLKRWFSKIATPITVIPEGMSLQADLNGQLYTVVISPEGKGQIKEISISFMENGSVNRLVITEKNGDRSTMSFRKFRRNIGLTDNDFRME